MIQSSNYKLIEESVDLNADGEVSIIEAESVNSLNLSNGWNQYYISDLTGIEYFINIDALNFAMEIILPH